MHAEHLLQAWDHVGKAGQDMSSDNLWNVAVTVDGPQTGCLRQHASVGSPRDLLSWQIPLGLPDLIGF